MSALERAFCRSAPWKTFGDRVVVPWALRDVDLTGPVLEIGGGSGAMAEVIAKRMTRAEYTLTDLDPVMVRAAERRLSTIPHATVRQADVTRLPFSSDSFDHVVSYLMLHHVVEWPTALKEVRRVLRPGGSLSGYDLTRSIAAAAVHVLDRSPYRLLAPGELTTGLRGAGFTNIAVTTSVHGHVMKFQATA